MWDIDTGHDLMVSEPQAVAGFLELVAVAKAETETETEATAAG
ncbi:hypothetical protein OG824_12060 [Streptomyces prunicolor]|nr:hypothetical protein [Streptomyces prunicolor]MCX5235936.1 hypothetical protein [Streptomyces prunicolor]